MIVPWYALLIIGFFLGAMTLWIAITARVGVQVIRDLVKAMEGEHDSSN